MALFELIGWIINLIINWFVFLFLSSFAFSLGWWLGSLRNFSETEPAPRGPAPTPFDWLPQWMRPVTPPPFPDELRKR